MAQVSYAHSFQYNYDVDGTLRPLLRFVVSSIRDPSAEVEVEASLDTGAERSLFDGRIAVALGIDVLRGPELNFRTLAGGLLSATLHTVRLSHGDLGAFELQAAFSSGEIERNLLGRDFFDLIQIGFREHQLAFFVTPTP